VGAHSSESSSGESVPAGSVGTGSALVHAALDPVGDEARSFSAGGVETGSDFV
jgi:hypothetical protein